MPPSSVLPEIISYRTSTVAPQTRCRGFVSAIIANSLTFALALYVARVLYNALTWKGGGIWPELELLVVGFPSLLLPLVFTPLERFAVECTMARVRCAMKAYSMDLRERVWSACERGSMTQPEVAEEFGVSVPFITKL